MNSLCKPIKILPFNPPPPPSLLLRQLPLHSSLRLQTNLPFLSPPPLHRQCHRITSSASEIDMVRTKDGIFTAKPKKVVVLWDLDNKPPRGPPYQAALSLKKLAQHFGDVVDVSAYANRHAFFHLPQWVLEQRRERRRLDILERKGVATPPEPYICGVCGRKCKTNLELKKHFKQLHERERQKKLNRMRSLKGKKRQRFKERFISGNHKYEEAAKTLVTPKTGYGLASELRRAGVFVKTVEDKPQAADWALKRQMQHSMSRGIDWLVLVSDDSDFSEMLRRARDSNLGTVVVGDWDRALGRNADLWVPWAGVENGEVLEKDLLPRTRRRRRRSDFDDEEESKLELDSVLDELVGKRTDFHHLREGDDEEEDEDNSRSQIHHFLDEDDDDGYEEDFLSDSDDEENWYT